MKVLVTGGAGFIGPHLTEKLLKNHEVSIIDNLSSGRKDRIPKNTNFIEGDLKDKSFIQENVKDFDVVFHFAASPDVARSMENTRLDIDENIITTYNLLEAMRKNNIKKLIFTSTSTVYGEVNGSIPEEYGPLKPISLYGASKVSCEAMISAYSEFGIKSWIFRLANIIGEKSNHGVIIDFVRKLKKNPSNLIVLGDGEQEKSYLYVDDCVDAILYTYKNSDRKTNIFNIGSDDTIKVKKIAKLVRNKISPEANIKYTGGKKGWKGDVPKFHLNISKIKSIGWKPNYNSEESVKKTLEGLKKQDWNIN